MEGNSRSTKIYIVCVAIALCLVSLHCKAQVTFSRDWNAGKRTVDNPDLRASIKSATTLCHLLITQIRQVASCETTLDRADTDPVASSYTEIR